MIVSRYARSMLKQLDQVFNHGTVSGLTEGKLLERFVDGRDETAFAALVARHGPMVLGVCRRILRNENDVEDAFQATFLVLIRRAGAIRRGDLVSHWLHGVAHRVAVRAKAQAARRRVREKSGLKLEEISSLAPGEQSRHELRLSLDDELARLPASLRSPVILCYLEGLTHDEAARRLRWPVGTVRSRLARARDVLRKRLASQGIMTDGAALTAALARHVVSLELIESTVQASLGFAAKQATTAAVASTSAATLARGVLHAMMISKIKILGLTSVLGILCLGGAHTLARQYGGMGGVGQPETRAPAKADRADALLRSVDQIEGVLADLDRRNLDLRKELRTLRTEIVSLRSGRPENAVRDQAPISAAADSKRTDAAATKSGPSHFENGNLFVVCSQRGDRVAICDGWLGKTSSIQLPVPQEARHQLTPIWGPPATAFVALNAKGPNVSRIAAYVPGLTSGAGWCSQELREPVDEALASVRFKSAAYALGRYVYAFSAPARRWDVLELPPGSQPELTVSGNQFRVEHGSHLYTFDTNSGKWNDVDFDAILSGSLPESLRRKLAPMPVRGLQ